jgi:hypothetical protein
VDSQRAGQPTLDSTTSNHKEILTLILTILQCSTFPQIQDSVIRLSGLVEMAVSSSAALSLRLSRLEGNSIPPLRPQESIMLSPPTATSQNSRATWQAFRQSLGSSEIGKGLRRQDSLHSVSQRYPTCRNIPCPSPSRTLATADGTSRLGGFPRLVEWWSRHLESVST